MSERPRVGGIVLCGGRSRRMGLAKEWMLLGAETLLQRTVRIVSQVVPVVVTAARPDQPLPSLPDGVRIVADRADGAGPMMGLCVGLEALAGEGYDTAFAAACDHPGLSALFITRLIERCDDDVHAVVVDYEGESRPLPAVYRTGVLPRVIRAIERGNFSLRALLRDLPARVLCQADFADCDPALSSMVNVNNPQAWERWLREQSG